MGNLFKARMCIALLVVSAGYSQAQENPTSSGITNPVWRPYNHNSNSIDPGEYYIIFREVGTTCISDTVEFEINLPEQPTAPIVSSITQPTCVQATGSVTLSGLPGGNWTINPGNITGSGTTVTITDLVAGQSYAFTVTANNNCASQPSDTISIYPQPPVPAAPIAQAQSLCAGSLVADLTAQVPQGASLLWYLTGNDGDALAESDSLASGSYYAASLSADGCESAQRTAVTVTINPLLFASVSLTANITEKCQGGHVIFTAASTNGGANPLYQWYKNNEPVVNGHDSVYTAYGLANGDSIWVRMTSNLACTNDSTVESDGLVVSVYAPLTIATNPVQNATYYGAADGSITITGIDGGSTGYKQVLLNGQIIEDRFEDSLTIDSLSAGNYFLLATDDSGCGSDTVRFIIDQPSTYTFIASVKQNASCFDVADGQIVIDTINSGYLSNYQYTLNNGTTWSNLAPDFLITGLAGNSTYTLVLKDYLGTLSEPQHFEVFEPLPVILVTSLVKDESYPGMRSGEVQIDSLSGGTGSFVVTLNGDTLSDVSEGKIISGLDPGNYQLLATDLNGCESPVCQFDIKENLNLIFSVLPLAPESCDGTGLVKVQFIHYVNFSDLEYQIDGGGWYPIPSDTIIRGIAEGEHLLSLKDGEFVFNETAHFHTKTLQPVEYSLSSTVVPCEQSGSILVSALSGGNSQYEYLLNSDQEKMGGTVTIMGEEYPWVKIGDQYWLAANLRADDNVGGIYLPNGEAAYVEKFGLLYSYRAAARISKAIQGWRLPAEDDWAELSEYLGGELSAGSKLKDSLSWGLNNQSVTNQYGFNALPAGQKLSAGFESFNDKAYFWAMENLEISELAGSRYLNAVNNEFGREYADTTYGRSVRLIMDHGSLLNFSGNWLPVPENRTIQEISNGKYNMVIRDKWGCPAVVDTISLHINSRVKSDTLNLTPVTCHNLSDGSLILNAISGGSGSGYQYQLDRQNWEQYPDKLVPLTNLAKGNHILSSKDGAGCTDSVAFYIDAPDPLGIDSKILARYSYEGRLDGTIRIDSVYGGNGGYTFKIDDREINLFENSTIGELAPGSHQLFASDLKGCSISYSIEINQVDSIRFQVIDATNICDSQGTIFISGMTGGIGSVKKYSFNLSDWKILPENDTITGLAPGVYQVWIADSLNNISAAHEFEVVEPQEVLFTINNITSICDTTGRIQFTSIPQQEGDCWYSISSDGFPSMEESEWKPLNNNLIFDLPVRGTFNVWVKNSNSCISEAQSFDVDYVDPVKPVVHNYHEIIYYRESYEQVYISSLIGGNGAGYTYSLDGGLTYQQYSDTIWINKLPFGKYDFIARDKQSCASDNLPFTVSPFGELSITVSDIVDTKCFGNSTGSCIVNISGGSESGYHFSINGGSTIACGTSYPVSGLTAGNYTVVAYDDQGLKSMPYQFEIKQPLEITFTDKVLNHASCFGEANGKLEISGILPQNDSYTFYLDGVIWDSFNNDAGVKDSLPAGNYLFFIENATGCRSQAKTLTIEQPEAFIIDIREGNPITCYGGGTTLTIGSLSGRMEPVGFFLDDVLVPSVEKYHDTIFNVPAGEHEVYAIDQKGCRSNSVMHNIAEPSEIVVEVYKIWDDSCYQADKGALIVTSITGGFSNDYKLYFNREEYPTDQENEILIDGLEAGQYTLYATDSLGCLSEEIRIDILQPLEPLLLKIETIRSVTCHGGSDGEISIVAISGGRIAGSPDYQVSIDGINWKPYQPDDPFTGLTAGNYKAYVRVGSCIASSNEVTVKEGNKVTVLLGNIEAETCFGAANGSVGLLSVSGRPGIPYFYSLNENQPYNPDNRIPFQGSIPIDGFSAGNHWVIGFDGNGCYHEEQFIVPANYRLTFKPDSIITASCNPALSDGRFKIKDITGAEGTSFWVSLGNDLDFIPLQSSGWVNSVNAGTYQVRVKDEAGCSSGAVEVSIGRGEELALKYSIDSIKCFHSADGIFSLTQINGSEPMNYLVSTDNQNWERYPERSFWNQLPYGPFSLWVKDEGNCATGFVEQFFDQPDSLILETYEVIDRCNSIPSSSLYQAIRIVSVLGGNGGYTYNLWDGKDTLVGNLPCLIDTFKKAQSFELNIKDRKGCHAKQATGKIEKTQILQFEHLAFDAFCPDGKGYDVIKEIYGGGSTPRYYSLNGSNDWKEITQIPLRIDGIPQGINTLQLRNEIGCLSDKQSFLIGSGNPAEVVTETYIPTSCSGELGSVKIVSINGQNAKDCAYAVNDTSNWIAAVTPFTIDSLRTGNHNIWVKEGSCALYVKQVTIPSLYEPYRVSIKVSQPKCKGGTGNVAVDSVLRGEQLIEKYYYNLDNKTGWLLHQSGSLVLENIHLGNHYLLVKDTIYENGGDFVSCDSRRFEFTIHDPSELMATFSFDEWACNTVNTKLKIEKIEGGAGSGYRYSTSKSSGNIGDSTWSCFPESDSVVYTESGLWFLKFSDSNNCFKEYKIDIPQKTLLRIDSISQIDPACSYSTGSVNIGKVSGGCGYSYKYQLDKGDMVFLDTIPFETIKTINVNPLAKELKVYDGKGCYKALKLEKFNIPDKISFVLDDILPVCSGDSGNLRVKNIIGGFYPYSYSIDNENWKNIPTDSVIGKLAISTDTIVWFRDIKGCMADSQIFKIKEVGTLKMMYFFKNAGCTSSDGKIGIRVLDSTSGYSYKLEKASKWEELASPFKASELLGSQYIEVRGPDKTIEWRIMLNKVPLIDSIRYKGVNFSNGMICFFSNGGGDGRYGYYRLNDGTKVQADLKSVSFMADQPELNLVSNKIQFGDSIMCQDTDQECIFDISSSSRPAFVYSIIQPSSIGQGDADIRVNTITGGSGAGYQYKFDKNAWLSVSSLPLLVSQVHAGEHSLLVRDNFGCESPLERFRIDKVLRATIEVANQINCPGDSSLTLRADIGNKKPGTEIHYYWYEKTNKGFVDIHSGLKTESRDTLSTIRNRKAGSYRLEVRELLDTAVISYAVDSIVVPDLPDLKYRLEIEHVTCYGGNNGSVAIIAEGGSGGYVYSYNQISSNFDGVFDKLNPGDYVFAFEDKNACAVSSIPVTITQPDSRLNMDIDQFNPTSVKGKDGKIKVTFKGGNPGVYTLYVYNNQKALMPVKACGSSGDCFVADSLAKGTYYLYGYDSKHLLKQTNGCTAIDSVLLNDPPMLVVGGFKYTPPRCHGDSTGSISLTVSGGTPYKNPDLRYRFTWHYSPVNQPSVILPCTTGVALNLSAGDYNIVATDSVGAMVSVAFSLEGPPPVQFTVKDSSDVACFGGNNGNILFDYADSLGFIAYFNDKPHAGKFIDSLTAGYYTIRVDDRNSCSAKRNIVIRQPDGPLTLGVSTSNTTKSNPNTGKIELSVNGGRLPYQVTLEKKNSFGQFESYLTDTSSLNSKTIDNLPDGDYRIQINDNYKMGQNSNKGCSVGQEASIYRHDKLSIELAENPKLGCSTGSKATLRAKVNGGNPSSGYSYKWTLLNKNNQLSKNDSLQVNTEGIYVVTVENKDGKITYKATDTIEVKLLKPIIVRSLTTHIGCYGQNTGAVSVEVQGGTGPLRYLWNNGSREPFLTNINAGNYSFTVTDSLGCTADTVFIVKQPASILYITLEEKEFTIIYPTSDSVLNGSIRFKKQPASGGWGNLYRYTWTNQDGLVIANSLNIDSLGVGVYYLTVTNYKDSLYNPFYNCSVTKEVVMVMPGKFLVDIDISGKIECPEDKTLDFSANVFTNTKGEQFSFVWTDLRTNLKIGETKSLKKQGQGEYSVLVTSKKSGFSREVRFSVSDPSWLQSEPQISPVLCKGGHGAILLNISGGKGPYKVVMNEVPAGEYNYNLKAGNYTFIITDNSNKKCSIRKEIMLTEPTDSLSLVFDRVGLPTGYRDTTGTVTAVPAGGTLPYSVKWYSQGIEIGSSFELTGMGYKNYSAVVKDINGCMVGENFDFGNPPLYAELNVTRPVLCSNHFNGIISLFATGGEPWVSSEPYRIEWFKMVETDWQNLGINSSELKNVAKGLYRVDVTDSALTTVSAWLNLLPVSNLQLSLSVRDANCSGILGKIEAQVTGGVGPVEYKWSNFSSANFIDGLLVGDYSLTVVDSLGCKTVAMAGIVQTGELGAEYELKGNTCHDPYNASIKVDIKGGSGKFLYKWSYADSNYVLGYDNQINTLLPERYQLAVSDTAKGYHCSLDTVLIIEEPPLKDIWFNKLPDTVNFCFGPLDTIHGIELPGNINAQYNWLLSGDSLEYEGCYFVPDTVGDYRLSVVTTEDGCNWVKDMVVKKSGYSLNTQFMAATYIHKGETAHIVNTSFFNGLKPENFDYVSWTVTGGTGASILDYSQVSASILFKEPGNFLVEIMIEVEGCLQVFKKEVYVNDQEAPSADFLPTASVFGSLVANPNPCSGEATILVGLKETQNFNLSIYDFHKGTVHYMKNIVPSSESWEEKADLSKLNDGLYIIVAYTASEFKTFKLIVKKSLN